MKNLVADLWCKVLVVVVSMQRELKVGVIGRRRSIVDCRIPSMVSLFFLRVLLLRVNPLEGLDAESIQSDETK